MHKDMGSWSSSSMAPTIPILWPPFGVRACPLEKRPKEETCRDWTQAPAIDTGGLGLTDSMGICPLGPKDPSSCGEGHDQGRAGAGPYKGPSCLGLREVLPSRWGLGKEAKGGEMDNERDPTCPCLSQGLSCVLGRPHSGGSLGGITLSKVEGEDR